MRGSLEYLLPSSFFLKENLKSSISKTHPCGLPLSMGFKFLFIFLLWKNFFHFFFFF